MADLSQPATVTKSRPTRVTRAYTREIADKEWWGSFLPEGWTLFGWTYRTSASAHTPGYKRLVQLDPEFLCAMTGRDYEKERMADGR